jgi:branched-chain amino acid transport system substrate-binding protein
MPGVCLAHCAIPDERRICNWGRCKMKVKKLRLLLGAVAISCAALASGTACAQGVTKTSILIGHSGPLSGTNKDFGEDIRNGALAYFEKVNQTGGINGRKIDLLSLDDANDTKRSAANAVTLAEEKGVLALFGYASATLSMPALPTVEKNKVPFVGPFTGAEPMRKLHLYVFNFRASYADELEKIVNYYTTTGMKSFAVLHYDDAVGKENLQAVEVALTKRGLKPVAVGSVKRNQTEISEAVSRVVKSAPDVVIATTLYRTTADFIKQAKKAGSAAQFASTSFVGASALAKDLGPAGRGVIVAQVVPPVFKLSVPVVKEYQAAIEKKLGKQEYSFTSLEAYIGAKVLVEAIRRAGPNLSRESLVKSLEAMQYVDVGGYVIEFSPSNHNGSKFVELTVISAQGRFSY